MRTRSILERATVAAVVLVAGGCFADRDKLIGGDPPIVTDDGDATGATGQDAGTSADDAHASGLDSSNEPDRGTYADGAGEVGVGDAGVRDGEGGVLVLFNDNFDDGNPGARWSTYAGPWTASAGQYTAGAAPYSPKAIANGTWFTDFTYEADITPTLGVSGDVGLIFRASNPAVGDDSYFGYYCGVSPSPSSWLICGKVNNGWTLLVKPVVPVLPTNHIKIVATGANFQVYLNGATTPVTFTDTTNPYLAGSIGLRVHQMGASFDNVVVTH